MGRVGMLRGIDKVSIGHSCHFGSYFFLTAWPTQQYASRDVIIRIGNNCCFGAWNNITGINHIEIGDGCLTGKWVTISDNSHGDTNKASLLTQPNLRPLISKGRIVIGKNVWIGEKATILPGVTIGEGAVIGANTVVNKDVPAYCVAVGNPMRIINKE